MGGLDVGAADLVLSREIWPIESLPFEQVMGYLPLAVEVATGSFDVPTKSDSLDIFVHRSNPVERLTFAELSAIFSGKDTRFRPYGYLLDNVSTRLFQDRVMGPGSRFAAEYREFGNVSIPGGGRIDAGQRYLKSSTRTSLGSRFRASITPLARSNLVPFPRARANCIRFPHERQFRTALIRSHVPFMFFLRRESNAAAIEFLNYVLSAAGQNQAAGDGYLPLPDAVVRAQTFILHSFFQP